MDLVLPSQVGDLQESGLTFARFNWSRWVVDCSSPWCTSAMTLPAGTLLMRCLDCSWFTEPIVWPEQIDMIETVLLMRPDEKTRNWEPGETVFDLIAENLQHGIIQPPAELDGPPTTHTLIRAVGNAGLMQRVQPGRIPEIGS